jgi:hypothetical protein
MFGGVERGRFNWKDSNFTDELMTEFVVVFINRQVYSGCSKEKILLNEGILSKASSCEFSRNGARAVCRDGVASNLIRDYLVSELVTELS